MLSDIGSWASILSLTISLFVASKVYKISVNLDKSKENKQENKDSSFIKNGDTNQSNSNIQ